MVARVATALHARRFDNAPLEQVLPDDESPVAHALVWAVAGVSVHRWLTGSGWEPPLPVDAALVRMACVRYELRWARLPQPPHADVVLGAMVMLSEDDGCLGVDGESLPLPPVADVIDWSFESLRLREFVVFSDYGNAVVVEDLVTLENPPR